MGSPGLIGKYTLKPVPVDCLAKGDRGLFWHFRAMPEDIVTDPVPFRVQLPSSTTAYSVGDTLFKSKRTWRIQGRQPIDQYVIQLNRKRIRDAARAKAEEEFEKFATAADLVITIAGLCVGLGEAVAAYRLWVAKSVVEALKVCAKCEIGRLSGSDALESVKNLLLDELILAEFKAVATRGIGSIIERIEKGYKIYEPFEQFKTLAEFGKAWASVSKRPPTAVDYELQRVHNFRYAMDCQYTRQFDHLEKVFARWRKG